MSGRAVVLGGGVAGIAAALGLRDRGWAVSLLESRGWLGGRAFSFEDRVTGERVDNGPHVMLGCYRAMRGLLRRLGTEDGLAAAASLRVAYRDATGERAELCLGRMPAPLAMPRALWRLPWSLAERLRGTWGLGAVLLGAPGDWRLSDWVERRGQRGAPADFLWEPLCRAIMNTEMEHAEARMFLRTLREAFSGSAASAAMMVPARPWGELVGDAAERALAAAGVEVQLGARVIGVEVDGGRVGGLQLRAAGRLPIEADDVVVSAMPWHALARLLGKERPFAGLRSASIVSAHFLTGSDDAAPADDGPITALVGGAPFHFLCRAPGAPRRRFALLAGGAEALDGLTVADIEQLARAQLKRHLRWDPVTPARVRITKEAAATFLPEPGVNARRPRPGRLAGGPSNLLVCGDWTDCGLPATLEGAARSAEMVTATLRAPRAGPARG